MVEEVVEQIFKAEMEEPRGAAKGKETPNWRGYRSSDYSRSRLTRMGKLKLRVPQDRQGRFLTEALERYQRSEEVLLTALMEMHLQGPSTRTVKAITQRLCGHEFSAVTISRMVERLDAE